MKFVTLRTMTSLTACLMVGSCMAGDFCDVVRGPIGFAPETARQVVETDREDAEAIEVQNVYGRQFCAW